MLEMEEVDRESVAELEVPETVVALLVCEDTSEVEVVERAEVALEVEAVEPEAREVDTPELEAPVVETENPAELEILVLGAGVLEDTCALALSTEDVDGAGAVEEGGGALLDDGGGGGGALDGGGGGGRAALEGGGGASLVFGGASAFLDVGFDGGGFVGGFFFPLRSSPLSRYTSKRPP